MYLDVILEGKGFILSLILDPLKLILQPLIASRLRTKRNRDLTNVRALVFHRILGVTESALKDCTAPIPVLLSSG